MPDEQTHEVHQTLAVGPGWGTDITFRIWSWPHQSCGNPKARHWSPQDQGRPLQFQSLKSCWVVSWIAILDVQIHFMLVYFLLCLFLLLWFLKNLTAERKWLNSLVMWAREEVFHQSVELKSVLLLFCRFISYWEQYQDYDPFLIPTDPPNPWISDCPDYWEAEKIAWVLLACLIGFITLHYKRILSHSLLFPVLHL